MRLLIRGSKKFFSPALQEYARKRFLGLEKVLDSDSDASKLELRVEKVTKKHHEGRVWQAKANLSFPGQLIRAECIDESPQAALDVARDELRKSVIHFRERLRASRLRGSRKLKKDLHLSPQARFYRKGRIRQEGR